MRVVTSVRRLGGVGHWNAFVLCITADKLPTTQAKLSRFPLPRCVSRVTGNGENNDSSGAKERKKEKHTHTANKQQSKPFYLHAEVPALIVPGFGLQAHDEVMLNVLRCQLTY